MASPDIGRIAVTGAAGFVGRAVVARLRQDGIETVAIDRLPGDGILAGDLSDSAFRREALANTKATIHLAAVPGGAAEADYALSRRINLDLTLALMEEAQGRFIYASSIAVFGAPSPEPIDDDTPPRPALTYGAHKLMSEVALANLKRLGRLDGIALRLPGIVARPRAASGLKSAFMSDVFHALAAGEAITLPVSPQATMWMLSAQAVAEALIQAVTVRDAPAVLTLPALRVGMGELVAALGGAGKVSYVPDAALEAQFGAYPPLSTPAADRLGFRHDGDLATLVRRALP
jgi:nucleoside-diphosphate-sugar epimerase